jgi:hypothetical protein
MSWLDWREARSYTDWRLGLKSAEDLAGEDFDG